MKLATKSTAQAAILEIATLPRLRNASFDMAWTSLCEASELKEGEGKYVEEGGYRLAVFLYKGEPYVIDNECPHAGGDMSGGWVDDAGCAVCPWHAWSFELCSGKLKGSGAVGLSTYPVRKLDHDGKTLVQADLKLP